MANRFCLSNWLESHPVDEVVKAMEEDKDLLKVRERIQCGKQPDEKKLRPENPALRSYWLTIQQFKVIDQLLYYRWEDASAQPHDKLVVPRRYRREVI